MTQFRVVAFKDWPRPPLTANQRLHWAKRMKLTRAVRERAALELRKFGQVGRVEVRLVWYVKDRRRRDADNLVPTLKALCDGIVDAGVVRDDTPEFMHKVMPVIEYRPGVEPHLRLEVEEIP